MLRIVLRVTHAPQPDFGRGGSGRFIPVGETVALEAESEREMLVKLSSYAHCCRELVEGEMPTIPHPFLGGVRKVIRKLKDSFAKPALTPEEPTPIVEPPEVWVCPWGEERFGALEGLLLHWHNAHADQLPEEATTEAVEAFALAVQANPEAVFPEEAPADAEAEEAPADAEAEEAPADAEETTQDIRTEMLAMLNAEATKTEARIEIGGREEFTYAEFDRAWSALVELGVIEVLGQGKYQVNEG